MLTRKKSIQSRTRRARRQRSKFVTPDLVLSAGKLMRFVSSPDNPLSKAEHLRGEYAKMEAGDEVKVRQFLQRVYFVAVQFRQLLGDFEQRSRPSRSGSSRAEAAGPFDDEVGPLPDHASDHDGLAPSLPTSTR